MIYSINTLTDTSFYNFAFYPRSVYIANRYVQEYDSIAPTGSSLECEPRLHLPVLHPRQLDAHRPKQALPAQTLLVEHAHTDAKGVQLASARTELQHLLPLCAALAPLDPGLESLTAQGDCHVRIAAAKEGGGEEISGLDC